MKIDSRELPDGSVIEAPVILIGGGIVGIALSCQLAQLGHDVVVLESGGENPDDKSQALYEGTGVLEGPARLKLNQNEYLSASRVRYFGGSGNRWGGVCVPLDGVDFATRDWVPHSGWPFDREHLEPHYNRASDFLDIPHFFGSAAPEPPLRINGERRLHLRPHYRTRYTGALANGPFESLKDKTLDPPRIRVYLHANVTHIRVDDSGQSVEELAVQTLDGKRHTARANRFVLATGGIENVRLLLASNDVHSTGIGNHSDWLGRAFQGHALVGNALSQYLPLKHWPSQRQDRFSWLYGTTAQAQREIGSGNFSLYLNRGGPSSHADAVHGLASRLGQAEPTPFRVAGLRLGIEHTPNRDSRIALSEDNRDALGMPRVHLRWKHSAFDLGSLDRSLKQVVREMGRHDVARLRWSSQPPYNEAFLRIGARHHMGATRMATSSRDGVVDEHCRVHGIDNLYIGGSSVFPTSGIANPTLTILALSFRLGDHLNTKIGGRA